MALDSKQYDKLTEKHYKRLEELAHEFNGREEPNIMICMSRQYAEAFKPWLMRFDHNSLGNCCQCGMEIIYDRRRSEKASRFCVRCAEALAALGRKEFHGLTSDITELDESQIYRGIEKSMSQQGEKPVKQDYKTGTSLGMYL